jgi:hypothetical protein
MTTVKELRILARDRNIRAFSKMRKADLLEILNLKPPPTIKDLKKIAKERNIKGYYKMKKADLINVLQNDVNTTVTEINQTKSACQS